MENARTLVAVCIINRLSICASQKSYKKVTDADDVMVLPLGRPLEEAMKFNVLDSMCELVGDWKEALAAVMG
jgi:hypothetical protein